MTQPIVPSRSLAEIVMLPTGEVLPAHLRPLENWSVLRDPTIMSLPNDRYGFSEILRIDFARPLQVLPDPLPKLELAPGYSFPPHRVTPPVVLPALTIANARLREPLELPAVVEPAPVPPGVYWTHPDGTAFLRLPPMELAPIAGAEAPLPCIGPTRLLTIPRSEAAPEVDADDAAPIAPSQHMLRVQVEVSSGNPVLDQLAVDHVRRHVATWPDHRELTDEMRWWLDRRHRIVVHWRYAPNVREIADPIAPEDWHDRRWY